MLSIIKRNFIYMDSLTAIRLQCFINQWRRLEYASVKNMSCNEILKK